MVFRVQFDEGVECVLRSVEGEAEVADTAGLTLLEEELHHVVVLVSVLEHRVPATSDRVEEVVVDVVGAQVLERPVVHLFRFPFRPAVEVGEFGCREVSVPGIAAQGYAGGLFRLSLQICGGGVEVVHPVIVGVIDQLVHRVLVDVLSAVGVFNHGPTHAAVSEQRHLVAVAAVGAEEHLAGFVFLGGLGLDYFAGGGRGGYGGSSRG